MNNNPDNLITNDNGTVKAGPGRPKGSPNKTGLAAKEAIAYAAEGLGGADRLIDWCKEDPLNERAFWTSVYPKLLPLQVANADGDTFRVSLIELVAGVKNTG